MALTKRSLGSSGLEITTVGFGSWAIGWRVVLRLGTSGRCRVDRHDAPRDRFGNQLD